MLSFDTVYCSNHGNRKIDFGVNLILLQTPISKLVISFVQKFFILTTNIFIIF